MSHFVIGIGGTGAKCVESFIHLCAAGLMADNSSLSCLFVDPDGPNGSLKRTSRLLQNYNDCRQLKLGAADLFKSELRISRPEVWTPFRDKPLRLDQFFNYDALHQNATAHLFDVLYTQKEKQTSLEFGFRGHPSIGAAAMAASVKMRGEEPWDTLFANIKRSVGAGEMTKVMLFGSIFGGTGASGVPTISRLIANEFPEQVANGRIQLGSVLMLPYFSFDQIDTQATMAVNAHSFLLSTQAALDYYFRQDELKVCNAVYLLGEETWKPMRTTSIGGEQQENEPHLLEMYAALAAMHFFANGSVDGYPLIARESRTRTRWADLPHSHGFEHLKQKIDQLARFAFAFLTSYYPMLVSINEGGRDYRAPWYVNFFRRKDVNLRSSMEKELGQVKAYCESVLLWLANVEQSRANGENAGGDLINFNAFAEVQPDEAGKPVVKLKAAERFNREAFGNLLLPITKGKARALSELWERMSDTRIKDPNAQGVGGFVRALYDACAVAYGRS